MRRDRYGDQHYFGNQRLGEVVPPPAPGTVQPGDHATTHLPGGSDPVFPVPANGYLSWGSFGMGWESILWDDIEQKPSVFPAAPHAPSHAPGALDTVFPAPAGGVLTHNGTEMWWSPFTWESLEGKPSSFVPSAHATGHLPGAVDTVFPSPVSGALFHNGTSMAWEEIQIADVAGLQAALNAAGGSPSWGAITSKPAGLITNNPNGTSRLYRADDPSAYFLAHTWTGAHWYLKCFDTDTNNFHAHVRVGLADNADTLDGLHASQLQEVMSQRDFPNGTLVQTSIPYDYNGSAFLLRITGNSYGAGVPFDTLVQGYIYNDTIINYGGIANGTHFSDFRAIRVGGNLAFWWPRMEYWQGFNVHVQDTLGSTANKVTSITDSALPTTDKMVQLGGAIRYSIHSGNIASQNVNSATYLQGHAPDENATGATIVKRLSGGGIRATDFFVDGGWVRLSAEGTGLYCPINGASFYPSASGAQWISQSGNGFRIRNLAGADKGWLYFDNSGFGLLNSAGDWSVQCIPGGGGSLFGNWGVVGNLNFSFNYGHGIVGLYSSVRYQQVYAMGGAYTMAADGTALNDFYGIAWTHHNVGGQSISGLGHQALFCMGGVTQTAIGAGVWTRGAISAWGNITAYASDKRLKENIEVIPDALEKVKAIHGVTYQWNREAQNYLCDDGRRHAGVLAQEIQAVLPEAVDLAPFDRDNETGKSKSGQNYLTVQNDRIVALLIEAVKELSAKVDRLEAELGAKR